MEDKFYSDEDSESEMFESIDWFDNSHEEQHDGKTITILEENFGNCLFLIHRFSKSIQETDYEGFIRMRNKFGKTVLKEMKYATYFNLMNTFIAQYRMSKGSAPSEYVALFFEAIEALKLEDFGFDNPSFICCQNISEADIFNSLISWIREKARTKEFKKKVAAREYNYVRNFRSSSRLFDALRKKHADLLIIRIDLSYREEIAKDLCIKVAKNDIKRLFNNRRTNKIFKFNVGYLAKLEYKPKKGLHFHVVFFFNGAKRQNHAWLADEIGKYWRDCVTKGRGIFHNCNKGMSKYKQCGIGEFHYSDENKANIFKNRVIKYVTKPDDYIRHVFGNEERLFFKGVAPKNKSNSGRHRLVEKTEHASLFPGT